MTTTTTEADLELLEMYLDDALSDRELAAVAKRIADEPQLAAELERLKIQRDLRREMFASLEPTPAAVERLLGRVDESIRRRSWWERQAKWGRFAAAAAACIVLGFAVGQVGRGPAQQQGPGVAVNHTQTSPLNNTTAVAKNDEGQRDKIQFVGKIRPTVQISDDSGRVIAVQHFETIEKANEFANDIRTWQDRQRQMQTGNVQLMGGKF